MHITKIYKTFFINNIITYNKVPIQFYAKYFDFSNKLKIHPVWLYFNPYATREESK